MFLDVKIGDLFESKCSTIVNTVNCVGVMGKGIALEFKNRYPKMFDDYLKKCNDGYVKIGMPYIYTLTHDKNILNFPTKIHWRSPTKLSYIIEGLDWFVENYKKYDIKSIAFPPLGCGNGGLSWELVGPIMYKKLYKLPIDIEIYAPYGTNKKYLTAEFLNQANSENEIIGKMNLKINPKWYLILGVIRELNNRIYSLNVGRTIFQKICYVITRNGVDTNFKFTKGKYGPFSYDAKNAINILANNNLIIEKMINRMISITVNDDVIIDKEKYTELEWRAMQRTIDLFGRVKNTEQAELVTTILFSYDELHKIKNDISDKELYNYIIDWKPHWKTSKDLELSEGILNLAALSLIEVKNSKELEYGNIL